MKPDSYRIQNGCINCKHVFVLFEYDEHNQYFCHVDKAYRPKCGSIAMDNERFKEKPYLDTEFISDEELKERHRYWCRQMRRWEKWAEPREVEPHGICDKHEGGGDV